MAKPTFRGAVSSIAVAALLAGCGAGGGSTPAALPHTASPTTMSFVVKVPASSSLAKAIRTRHYTSRDATGIGLRGGNTTPLAPSFPNAFTTAAGGIQDYTAGSGSYYSFTFNLAPSTTFSGAGSNAPSENCGSAGGDGSFTCTFTIPVQAGYYAFQIALWDKPANSAGTPTVDGSHSSFTGGTPVGIETLTNQLVLANQSTTLPMVLGGVVDSVQTQLDPNLFIANGGNQTARLYAIAKDAAGDIIIGSEQYVDAGGNNLTLTAQAPTGAIAADFSYPGTKTFNTPSDTVAVQYNNGAAGGAASFALSPSSAITGLNAPASASATSTGGGSLGIPGNPTVNTAAGTAPSGNAALAQDASGNVWAGTATSTTISQMLKATHDFTGGSTATLTTGTGVSAMAAASNGIICFVAVGTNEIGCFDPAAPASVGYTAALASAPNDIAQGPDGNIWVAEANGSAAKITASAAPSASEYAVTGITQASHISSGPNGNLWVIDTANSTVAIINALTQTSASVTVTGASLSSPNAIVEGSDGNMWVAQRTPAAIPNPPGPTTLLKIVPGTGAATSSLIPGVSADTLTNGPDGNLWMSDSTANKMAAVSPANGKLLKAFALGATVSVTAEQILTNTADQSVYVSGLDSTGPTPHLYYFTP